jgi:WD40 repeat protein
MRRLAALTVILLAPLGCGSMPGATPTGTPRARLVNIDEAPLPRGAVARRGTRRLRHIGPIDYVAFSADGQSIESVGGGQVRIWDIATGTRRPDEERERALLKHKPAWWTNAYMTYSTLSADESHSTAGYVNGSIMDLDIAANRRITSFTGHKGKVSCLAYSIDNRRLFSGGQDKTLRVWDIATGKELRRFTSHKAAVTAIKHHSDGRHVLSGDATGRVILWDGESGDTLRAFAAHPTAVTALAFNAGRSRIITGGADHVVRLWDAKTLKQILVGPDPEFNAVLGLQRRPAFVQDAAYVATHEPTGHILAGYGGSEHVIWDKTGKELARFSTDDPGQVGLFFPDGNRVLIAEQPSYIEYDWQHQEPGKTFTQYWKPPACGDISPDGSRIVTKGRHRFYVWDYASGKEVSSFSKGMAPNTCVRISPGGDRVVSGDDKGVICLWDIHAGSLIREFKPDAGCVVELEWLDEDRFRSAHADTTAITWQTHTVEIDRKEVLKRLEDESGSTQTLLKKSLKNIRFGAPSQAKGLSAFVFLGDESVEFMETFAFPKVGPSTIEKMCRRLGAQASRNRRQARALLLRIGAPALPRLKELAADTPGDPEVFLTAHSMVDLIERTVRSRETRWRYGWDARNAKKCVPVLEMIGTQRSRELLEFLADGKPDAALTLSAKAALRRTRMRLEAQDAPPPTTRDSVARPRDGRILPN